MYKLKGRTSKESNDYIDQIMEEFKEAEADTIENYQELEQIFTDLKVDD